MSADALAVYCADVTERIRVGSALSVANKIYVNRWRPLAYLRELSGGGKGVSGAELTRDVAVASTHRYRIMLDSWTMFHPSRSKSENFAMPSLISRRIVNRDPVRPPRFARRHRITCT